MYCSDSHSFLTIYCGVLIKRWVFVIVPSFLILQIISLCCDTVSSVSLKLEQNRNTSLSLISTNFSNQCRRRSLQQQYRGLESGDLYSWGRGPDSETIFDKFNFCLFPNTKKQIRHQIETKINIYFDWFIEFCNLVTDWSLVLWKRHPLFGWQLTLLFLCQFREYYVSMIHYYLHSSVSGENVDIAILYS